MCHLEAVFSNKLHENLIENTDFPPSHQCWNNLYAKLCTEHIGFIFPAAKKTTSYSTIKLVICCKLPLSLLRITTADDVRQCDE